MSRLSLIGITDCGKQNVLHAYHISGDIHVSVAAFAAPGVPVIFPSLANRRFASDILDGLDGTPITVTPFNIEPIQNNSGATIALGAACDSARLAFCDVVQKKHDSLSYT
ncbi:gamma-glutamyl-gamma-aminobutyrate hydrolase family protein [Pseudomonas sp.]|uniref:gamma-glutamyl-gamma-aminobutyrate hydrolase family protein n=1 Tax=Pseudomonas sp. TaxID=306 RepID=UPI002583EC10|nr:gamma-glutamyl-gamma-aminobutyrate hydrolase family protein [Pseudomonas sp.]